jgi:IS5 family transposase
MKTLIKNTFTTYNNTVNLITHIVEKHFSILNKFKHLLVFGTLALSLNVTSGETYKARKLREGIMRKKPKGKPMSHWNKVHNKTISKRRFVVEHTYWYAQTHLWLGKDSLYQLRESCQ